MISIQELESFFSAQFSFAPHNMLNRRSIHKKSLPFQVQCVYGFIISVVLGIFPIFNNNKMANIVQYEYLSR